MKINYSLHNHCFYIKVQQREIQTLWFLLFLLKWKLNTTSFEKCLKTIYKHFFGQDTYKNRIENGRNFFEFPLKWWYLVRKLNIHFEFSCPEFSCSQDKRELWVFTYSLTSFFAHSQYQFIYFINWACTFFRLLAKLNALHLLHVYFSFKKKRAGKS